MWVTPGGQKWPLVATPAAGKGHKQITSKRGQSLLPPGNLQITCPVSWKFLAVETFLLITNLSFS